MEKFSVRGDGLMTATTAAADVSAVVAHATDGAAYTGSVLVAQSARPSHTGFYLFKVRGGLRPGESLMFGCTCRVRARTLARCARGSGLWRAAGAWRECGSEY